MLEQWLKSRGMTYRQAGELTGLNPGSIHHFATGGRIVGKTTAKALDKLDLPRDVRTWLARNTVRVLEQEMAWWREWAKDDLKDEWSND